MHAQHDDHETLVWPPVNPKALTIDGLLFRCPLCFSLVIDLDRDAHVEAMHAPSIEIPVLLRVQTEHHAAA